MKRFIDFSKWAVTIFIVLLFSACSVYSYTSPSAAPVNDYPEWAPYYSEARYYYLPDIETYYDINAREFVYLQNGRWSYYRNLPRQYSDYDLNNCYTIVLNANIYQPWMHHQYYVSHYPRYYYRDYYDRSNFAYVRGYNENTRSAFYWEEKDYHRARNWDNSNESNNRNFKYSKEDQQQYNRRNVTNNSINHSGNQTNRPTVNTDNNTTNDRNVGGTRTPVDNQNTNNNTNNSRNPVDNRNTNNSTDRNVNGTRTTNDSQNNSNATDRNVNGNRTPVENRSTPYNTTTPAASTTDRPTTTRTATENKTESTTGTEGTSRTSQGTNYYGRTIGQPVKVEKQMRANTTKTTTSNRPTNSTNSSNTRTNGDRR